MSSLINMLPEPQVVRRRDQEQPPAAGPFDRSGYWRAGDLHLRARGERAGEGISGASIEIW